MIIYLFALSIVEKKCTFVVHEKNMTEEKNLIVDIDKILKQKAGAKAGYVPRFLVSWLKHIIHQDEVNRFLSAHKEEVGVEWLKSCVKYLDMRLMIKGEENLPPNNGKLYTFVSNHPLGGGDGVALGALIGGHYEGNIRYLLNDLLMTLPGLRPVGIPINKTGVQGRSFPQMVQETFHSDKQILMFPAGICSRRHGGVVHDVPWKKTFITKSVETHRDVVPIHFSGENSVFFYRLANICAALGLKFNVAMLFLVNEMYKNVHKSFEIKVAKPIPWETFDNSRSASEWARYVEDIVYHL
jgi:hypothetical protein